MINFDVRPGVEVFQVLEGHETFAVKEQMLVQHLVPDHRDHCGRVCDADYECDFES